MARAGPPGNSCNNTNVTTATSTTTTTDCSTRRSRYPVTVASPRRHPHRPAHSPPTPSRTRPTAQPSSCRNANQATCPRPPQNPCAPNPLPRPYQPKSTTPDRSVQIDADSEQIGAEHADIPATDPATTELLTAFARDRRTTLHRILDRARTRGELPADADLELLADQIYGVLWYRLAVSRTPLDAKTAARLIDSMGF
ncbi:TetR-like C-terminal domain-containing protein [Nocardia terpenica]|uniref:TetR-like C-terminal domain-containing protein n=1 Tax=Nocardia terpenica TaxID=455432 RepID=UPI0012E8943C|nr:hypothetical protein [Nocardia terpenica]